MSDTTPVLGPKPPRPTMSNMRMAPPIDMSEGYSKIEVTVTPWRLVKAETERKLGRAVGTNLEFEMPVDLAFVEIA